MSLRRLGAALGAVLLTALAAGCNSSAQDASPDTAPTAGNSASGGGTQYPLTLKTPYGETVLKSEPKRVAIAGQAGDLDDVLALGVTPVIAPKFATEWPWSAEALKGQQVEQTWDTAGGADVPMEKIAASNPDVIIAVSDANLKANYEKLSQIAPVVALPDEEASTEVDWRKSITVIGEALNKSDQAEEQLQKVDDMINKTASEHPEFKGKSITFAINYGTDYGLSYFNGKGSPAETFFTGLGFAPGDNADQFGGKENKISAEQLPLLDSDVLLINYNGGAADQKSLESDQLFKNLEAVKSGHYVGMLPTGKSSSPIAWSLARPSALNTQWSIDFVTPKLVEAVNGKQ